MINLLSQITANYFLVKPRATGIYVKMEVREHIFVPLGNGTLFLGVVFGLEHLLASGNFIGDGETFLLIMGDK